VTSTNPTGGASAWLTTGNVDIEGGPLWSLSCLSASLCIGGDQFGNVAASTNPTGGASAWTVTNVEGNNFMSGAGCASPTLCVVVDEVGHVVVGQMSSASPVPSSLSSAPGGGTGAEIGTGTSARPVPGLAQRHTVKVISGRVTVRVKGTTRFVPLSGTSTIPDGSEVEATNGRVLITVATLTPGQTQSAEVYGGRFLIHQEHTPPGETHLTLTLPLTGCRRVTLPRGSAAALAASAKRRSGPKARHLWVSEKGGSWGTNGRYVSTSVEGTHWLTLDECNKSEVKVVSGKVKVRDLVRNRTKTLTAGKSYVAVRG
jgi:hypothetical protein